MKSVCLRLSIVKNKKSVSIYGFNASARTSALPMNSSIFVGRLVYFEILIRKTF